MRWHSSSAEGAEWSWAAPAADVDRWGRQRPVAVVVAEELGPSLRWALATTTRTRSFEVARRGYAVGSAVLAAVLPANQGPTAAAPVAMDDTGLELADGIEAKQIILTQLAQALEVIRIANVAHWGIRAFSPDDLRRSTQPLLDWLTATGCSRVAIHFDVDTIDSNELVLGLGAEPGGLTTAQVQRITTGIDAATNVVGITVAEFIPRQVMHFQQLLTAFPLLRTSRSGSASGIVSQGGDPAMTGAIPDQAPRSRKQ